MSNPTRGEIYLVDLDPTIGAEMQKERRSVVVSNDTINCNASVIVVCPITDAEGKSGRMHIHVPAGHCGLTKDVVVHCGQIRAIDKKRLGKRMGFLDAEYMSQVETGIKIVLSL